jgi:long-chain alkane monooxygenase
VPELQRRGVYPTSYKPGTLREKLFGDGALLPDAHPAARYRDIERVKREAAARSAAPAAVADARVSEVETIR